jgi:2-polyprenyl-6-methoxyphenol hydroxylase-like FAD-dependent oxidoreductase
MGYAGPRETIVNAKLGYASRIYRRDPNMDLGYRAMFIQAAPPEQPRAGVLFPIEGERWLLTLAGGGGDYAPTRDDEFQAFARSLPHGGPARVVNECEPLTDIVGYRRTENRWLRYDKLRRMPKSFLVMGDAVCAFNPVYGQGITVAALEAIELDRCLHRRQTGAFQARIVPVVADCWTFATGEDVRYRGVEGARERLHHKALHWYVDRVAALSTRDRSIRHRYLNVFGMRKPASALFQPWVLWRVLRSVASGLLRRPRVVQNEQREEAHSTARYGYAHERRSL